MDKPFDYDWQYFKNLTFEFNEETEEFKPYFDFSDNKEQDDINNNNNNNKE